VRSRRRAAWSTSPVRRSPAGGSSRSGTRRTTSGAFRRAVSTQRSTRLESPASVRPSSRSTPGPPRPGCRGTKKRFQNSVARRDEPRAPGYMRRPIRVLPAAARVTCARLPLSPLEAGSEVVRPLLRVVRSRSRRPGRCAAGCGVAFHAEAEARDGFGLCLPVVQGGRLGWHAACCRIHAEARVPRVGIMAAEDVLEHRRHSPMRVEESVEINRPLKEVSTTSPTWATTGSGWLMP
jgi:hypothetical protein